MSQINFQEINESLLSQCPGLLMAWLPGGKVDGKEYHCSNISGGSGNSFNVNVETGKYFDFADESMNGGDLISLYSKIHGLSQIEAVQKIQQETGLAATNNSLTRLNSRSKPVSLSPSPLTNPKDIPPIPQSMFLMARVGKPVKVWTYYSQENHPIMHVARYKMPDNSKSYRPFTFQNGAWTVKALPDKRPLYGLEKLQNSDKNVMLCEGEKAVDAAQLMLGDKYDCLTWAGGTNGIKKADWSPLKGKKILIWPDNDSPGIKCCDILSANLAKFADVKYLDVSSGKIPEKFDAADAYDLGWTYDKWFQWAKPLVVLPKKQIVSTDPMVQLELQEQLSLDPNHRNQKWSPLTTNLKKWLNWGIDQATSGHAITNEDAAIIVLENDPEYKDVFWFDSFLDKPMVQYEGLKQRQLKDVDYTQLLLRCQRDLQLKAMKRSYAIAAVDYMCHSNIKNCAQEYLESLTWDGTHRVTTALQEYFSASEETYISEISQNFFISLVARVLDPGCKVDTMMVLEGIQGAMKSTALNVLAGEWFNDTAMEFGSKDFYTGLRGNMIIEVAELGSFSKSGPNIIKKVLSERIDNYRPPYGRNEIQVPRASVFVGTTNDSSYLKDPTGSRRFWPVKVGDHIDIENLEKDRDQLMAEAVHLFRTGHSWWNFTDQKGLDEARDLATVHDPLELELLDFCEHFHKRHPTDRLTTANIKRLFEYFTEHEDIKKIGRNVSNVLRPNGWENVRKSSNGVPCRVWVKKN